MRPWDRLAALAAPDAAVFPRYLTLGDLPLLRAKAAAYAAVRARWREHHGHDPR